MLNKDLIIKELKAENQKLQDEIVYLKSLLDNAGVIYNKDNKNQETHLAIISPQVENTNTTIRKYTLEERQKIIDSRIEIFMKLFCGRMDVFARRFISKKTGISGYAPVCANFWDYSLCPKSNGKKVKCFECSNHKWIPLSKEIIYKHLVGEKEDCTDVVGVYPMLQDETCRFLVFDTYDRMLPAQDKMPIGGFGNLVALPLQGQARKNGNSEFVDENWNVIKDTWSMLENIKLLSKDFVENKINEWSPNGILGNLASDMSGNDEKKPWEKKQIELLNKEDFDGKVNIIFANQVYVKKDNMNYDKTASCRNMKRAVFC